MIIRYSKEEVLEMVKDKIQEEQQVDIEEIDWV